MLPRRSGNLIETHVFVFIGLSGSIQQDCLEAFRCHITESMTALRWRWQHLFNLKPGGNHLTIQESSTDSASERVEEY
jgi:hypothetical protein